MGKTGLIFRIWICVVKMIVVVMKTRLSHLIRQLCAGQLGG